MAPALGGPLMTSQEDARELIPALEGELFALSTALDDREVQLDILSELIQGEQVKSDATPRVAPFCQAGCRRVTGRGLIRSVVRRRGTKASILPAKRLDIVAVPAASSAGAVNAMAMARWLKLPMAMVSSPVCTQPRESRQSGRYGASWRCCCPHGEQRPLYRPTRSL